MLHLDRSEYIEFLPNLFLKRGKIHQITGSARFILALIIGNVIQDQITWVRLERSNEILYPEGVSDWITLNNLIMVNTENEEESLWVMEEFLKSGVISLVFCQLNKLPKYVNLRRLNLSTKRSKEENRDDDNLKVIQTRYDEYLKSTKLVSKKFNISHSNIFYKIDGNKQINEITSKIKKILENS